ncbi:hypothetical protein D3C81_2159080 [compost metagenome]
MGAASVNRSTCSWMLSRRNSCSISVKVTSTFVSFSFWYRVTSRRVSFFSRGPICEVLIWVISKA